MNRFWQKEWHGIRFDTFATPSPTRLPDAAFYGAFYRELMRRHSGYEGLDAEWRHDKREIAEWIARRPRPGARVLSVGAGLGYIEHCLNRAHGTQIELHAQDFAGDALTWLRTEFPSSRIHSTLQQQVAAGPYDLIYLSAVDYALQTEELVGLLADLRTQLCPGGSTLLISASFLERAPLPQRAEQYGKDLLKQALEVVGLYHRGQFWGWQRMQSEYRDLFARSGYLEIADGFIRSPSQRTYYIEGRRGEG